LVYQEFNILSIQFLLRYSEKIENIQAKYFTAKHHEQRTNPKNAEH